ncbi:hypothetical protein Droror1_Dr00017798 [Drosera rotundifolia]
MNASSAAEISKIAAQNAEDKQLGRRLKKFQMNKERIQSIKAMIEVETQLMEYDEKIYSKQPGLIGSPNDAKRRFVARHARIEHLTAQAQAFLAYNVEEPPDSQTTRNLVLRPFNCNTKFSFLLIMCGTSSIVLTMRRTIQKKTEEKDNFVELLVAIASLQEDGPYPVIVTSWSCVDS